MNLYQYQKLCIISFLTMINALLISTMIIYIKYWYVHLIFLMISPIFNCIYSLLLYGKIRCKPLPEPHEISMETLEVNDKTKNKSLIIFLPCYNETIDELKSTLDSIYEQEMIDSNKKILMIICDGKIQNSDSVATTNRLLTDYLFLNSIEKVYKINKAYMTWDNTWEDLEIYCGTKNGLRFIIIVKSKNYGKRDSLTLLRKLVYNYNNRIELNQLTTIIDFEFNKIFINNIDYIYGTDADTILDKFCIYQLIKKMVDADVDTVAIVGFVDVNVNINNNIANRVNRVRNPLILFQFAEYIYAQCLRRKFQSKFTHKVNCLSGCNQLIKVTKETCGEEILAIFNKKPKENANIFEMILSSASEDRNHVTLMFKLYPYIKTIQEIKSIVHTNVPTSLKKFLIQRKRWTLGALCNDILLIINRKHNFLERLQSIVNVFVNMINLYILVATGYFIYAIIYHSSLLMLYLSIPIFIILLHMLLIPVFHYNLNERIGYYYISLIIYILGSPFLSFIQHFYTLLNLDNFNWNKKDVNVNVNKNENNNQNIIENNNNNNQNIIENNNNNNQNIIELEDYVIIETLI